MRRRGITADAIKRFCEEVSVTRRGNENVIGIELFDNMVRRDLDERCPRHFALLDPVSLTLVNLAAPLEVECPNFPKNKAMGSHVLRLTP
jgi:glutaminyl-tRNA synthetase